MSKAVILSSSVNGTKNGVEDILIPRFEKGSYEYEIEFCGGKCPKKPAIKEALLEIFNENEIIDSIDVKTNSKEKGKLNILVCISAFDNFNNSVHKIIDNYMKNFVGMHNNNSLATD